MNFVALIGFINHIEKIEHNNFIELKILCSKTKEKFIARIWVTENKKDFLDKVEIGKMVGINGLIDFSDNNKIILKNYTLIR